VAVFVVDFFFLGTAQSIYARQKASMPEAWSGIKPGMTSGEVRRILGEPDADGRRLKSLDRWYLEENGISIHLDVWMDGENKDDHAIVGRVVRWMRCFGWDVDLVELQ
jgi:hypothetical protein